MNYNTYMAAFHKFRTNEGYNKFYININTSIDLYENYVQNVVKKSSTKDEKDFDICFIIIFADIITMKEILKIKITNINMLNTDDYTSLWIACARGEWSIVELLLTMVLIQA